MSININTDATARSMLDMTLQSITQLGTTLKRHLEEEREIISHIKSHEKTLADLKQQHITVKAAISTIQQSIVTMKETEQQWRHALSPMRRFPDDILLHIFRIFIQNADRMRYRAAARWYLARKEDRDSQVRLGSVCRRWRVIINNNSSLWTTVEVLLSPSPENQNQENEGVAHWKKASKNEDQKLLIYDWMLRHHDALKQHLGTESIEWKEIHMIPCEDPATGFFGPYSSKEVTIYRNGLPTSRYFTPLMRRASVLTLYGSPPEWGALPWIQLRSFTLKSYVTRPGDQPSPLSFGREELTALLFAATELTELVLDFLVDEDTLTDEASTSITHRNLRFLSLHLGHFVAGKGPFGVTLHAPSLQTLDFISLGRGVFVGDNRIVSHWDDPRALSLPTMNDDDVLRAVELTKWLPNVQKLLVMGSNIDALFTFFHSILHHIPPPSLPLSLPKLESLFITDTDLRGETLIELLESRLRHVRGNTAGICAITGIKMYNSPAVTVAHWKGVQELLREGARSTEVVIEDGVARPAHVQ